MQGIVESRQSARIASREGNDVEIVALQDQPRGNRFAVGSSPENIVAVRRQIGEILDAVQEDVGFEAHDSGGLVDRLVGQERQRNSCHFRPRGIANHTQRGGTRIDGLHASSKFIRAVGVRTIEAVIAAAFALVKHDVEKRR